MVVEVSFEIYIKRVLTNTHPDTKLSTSAKTYIHNMCVHLIKSMSEISNKLMTTNNRVTINQNVVKNAALVCLDTFGEGSVRFAVGAVANFKKNKSGDKKSVALRAGLTFPPSKVHYYFSKFSTKKRYSSSTRIFTAAIVEDMVTYLLGNAVSITLSQKRTTVSLQDVTLSVLRNKDLYNFYSSIDNLLPEMYQIQEFLAYEQPKAKKEQKESRRPVPVIEKDVLDQESIKLSYSAVKRLGYRAGLRRFGNEVSRMVMGELYNEIKRVFKYCLVSMNYNKRKTLSPNDVYFSLDVLQGGTLTFPFKKVNIIPKKTVQEKKGRAAKTPATKTREWKKKVNYYQGMAGRLFLARDSFRRLIHHASEGRMYHNEIDMQSTIGVEQTPSLNPEALDMIQLHCERYVVNLLRKANNIAVYNKRQTVQNNDLYVVLVPYGVYTHQDSLLSPQCTPESNDDTTPLGDSL